MFIPYTYSVCVGTLVMVEYVQWMVTMMAILITLLLLYVLAKNYSHTVLRSEHTMYTYMHPVCVHLFS